MSKNKKQESQHGHENPGAAKKAVAIVIVLCFLGVMPILLWMTLPESSPYVSVTTSSTMVQTAARDAGLQICSSNVVVIQLAGAQNGVLSNLNPDCNAQNSENTVKVLSVGFDTREDQNAAIATAQDTYNNWQVVNTEAYTSGYTVLVVNGAPGNQDVQKVGASFIRQGAVRIF